MVYEPKVTQQEIEDNHKFFEERQRYYREKGLDFHKNRQFILEKTGRLNGRILEIGSSKGKTAVFLTRSGYDIVSVDTNEEMLKMAALNLAYENLLQKAELHVMDAYSLAFKDKSFNNVIMIEALHHIEDINGLFSELDRVLKDKGTLVLSDFNEEGMEIIDEADRQDGGVHENVHEDSFRGKEAANKWMHEKGYSIKSYEDSCHWVLVAKKQNKGRD